MLDVIPVPLGLAGFRVTGVERVERVRVVRGVVRVLEAGVEAVRGWSRCPWCGAGRRRVRGVSVASGAERSVGGVACGVGVEAPPLRVRGVRSDAC